MDNDTCIFCRIISGEVSSDTVYADDLFVAFLDIHPTTKGHTLLVPRAHIGSFAELSNEVASTLGGRLRTLAPIIANAVSATGFNLILNNSADAGQVVPHVHWHIIPRYRTDGLRAWPSTAISPDELHEVAGLIIRRLKDI